MTSPDAGIVTVSQSGAGFGDAAANTLVEAAAMRATVAHFVGWEPEDVSGLKCGWDITFRKGSEVVHAEVKGVSGRKPSILLTANEHRAARDDEHWVLVIVLAAMVSPSVMTFSKDQALQAASPYVFRVDLS